MTEGDRPGQNRRYRAKHAEEIAAYQREYRKTHREQFAEYQRRYRETHPGRAAADSQLYRGRHSTEISERGKAKRKAAVDYPFLDGESLNDEQGTARLVYLSCYSPKLQSHIRLENLKGLKTLETLRWMLEHLPSAPLAQTRQQHSLIAWYFGGYDTTLILRDLPAWLHWLLLHPEKRRLTDELDESSDRPEVRPVKWQGLYLDWMNNMLTIEDDKRRVTIYDIARYYQCSFLTSIKDWKVGTPDEHALIKKGKESRAEFSRGEFEFIKQYCDLETRLGSDLWRKLRLAHEEVGLKPSKWFGPGQTAKALLKKVYVQVYGKDRIGPGSGEVRWQRMIRHARLRVPHEAWQAFASAFFGGRFENSRYGVIERKTHVADIASAYPHAIRQLPCLVHGEWSRLEKVSFRELRSATLACVRYKLPASRIREKLSWAPLPFRTGDGSICFPVNAVGWAWLPEIEAARRLGFNPELLEAWVFKAKCQCPVYRGSPGIRDLYGERIRIGKEGAGMVIKFALNSCYGVKAQVLGVHEAYSLSPFQSFIEAGMITSITRAMLVDVIAKSKRPSDVLMVNTDSVSSLTPLDWLPHEPTPEVGPDGKSKPELGHWDLDTNENGLTLIKQGIYFDRDFKKLKARGIGRDTLQRNAEQIERALQSWIAGGPNQLTLDESRDVFHGQRQCVDRPNKLEDADWRQLAYLAWHGRPSRLADQFRKREYYGRWSHPKQRITFEATPKRERVFPDGRLLVRDMGGAESAPYDRALFIASLLRDEAPIEEILDSYEQDYPDFLEE